MSNLTAVELKAHLPSKDFDLSKQFYQDLGFTLCWSEGNLAYFHFGEHNADRHHSKVGFLLQNYYVKEFAENLMMHLIVEDVEPWWARVQTQQLAQRYGVRAGPPADREWGHRDFTLNDPAGVLWRIAQVIEP